MLLARLRRVVAKFPGIPREPVDVALDWQTARSGMTEPEELEHQLEAAYRAIEELDEDLRAGRLSPADHAESRKRAEAHAAQLLARLRDSPRLAQPEPSSPAPIAARRRTRTMIAGTAVLAFLAGIGIGIVLGRASAPGALMTAAPPGRIDAPGIGPSPGTAQAPGGVSPSGIEAGAAAGSTGVSAPPPHSSTAAPPPGLAAPLAAPSPGLQALDREASAENAPIQTILAFARLALEEKHRAPALSAYKRALALDPRNADAIAGIGIILHDGQFVDQALARFDEALAIDPKLARALAPGADPVRGEARLRAGRAGGRGVSRAGPARR